jgi:hypothetical protein
MGFLANRSVWRRERAHILDILNREGIEMQYNPLGINTEFNPKGIRSGTGESTA